MLTLILSITHLPSKALLFPSDMQTATLLDGSTVSPWNNGEYCAWTDSGTLLWPNEPIHIIQVPLMRGAS